MKSSRVSDDTDVLLKNDRIASASEVLDSLWIQNPSPSFHGAASSMVNFDFEQARGGEKSRLRRRQGDCGAESCDGEIDGCCLHHPPEKKRRLTAEQVRFLERSFEVENKLEPDRKSQLAKESGLQPRQVAIWFQNRRARSKTKVLEKEFDSLKSCYDKLNSDYDDLFSYNKKLRNEVDMLNRKLISKGNDPISPLDFATKDRSDNASTRVVCKPEEASTCSYSSHVVESDFSQDEDEFLVQRFCSPKLEVEYYDDDLQPNSCNLGFPVQDQGTWFWQC